MCYHLVKFQTVSVMCVSVGETLFKYQQTKCFVMQWGKTLEDLQYLVIVTSFIQDEWRLIFQGAFEWQCFHCDTLDMILQRNNGSNHGFLAQGILSHTPDPPHTVMISAHTQQNRNNDNGPTHLCKTLKKHIRSHKYM